MKIVKKKKIPTIIALFLLFVTLGLGTGFYFFQDSVREKNRKILIPRQIEVVNISDDSASITWQTNIKTTGKIRYGDELKKIQILSEGGEKNLKSSTEHFVSIRNLKPNTKYYYKVKSGEFFYPEKEFPSFTTAPNLDKNETDLITLEYNQPITGSVINANLEPEEGALVFLIVENAAKIATITNSFGNFILPLKNLLTSDLKKIYQIKPDSQASLKIIKGEQIFSANFTLPINNRALSGLQLGRSINLKEIQASLSAKTTPKPKPSPIENTVRFDLNNDKKVNSVDLSLVVLDFGKRSKNLKTDLNLDGLIDSDDIDLLQGQIK